MSIMAHITSQPPRSRQPSRGNPNAAAAETLRKALRLMADWPATWQIDDEDDGDLRYGEQLLEELKPFVMYLVGVEKLSRSTVRRHVDNLFLLGGELISHINIYEKDRKLPPARLLDDNLSEEGGPLCKHVQDGSAQQQYDATCKKLYAFRSARTQRSPKRPNER
jgi:hypothetical protein